MKRAWICVGLLAGCHGNAPANRGSAEPTAAPTPAATNTPAPVEAPPPRSPLADSFAVLPLSIISAEPMPIESLTGRLTRDPIFEPACWSAVAAKVDAYYAVNIANQPLDTVFHPYAVHGTASVDEVRRCRKPDKKRKESKNPKVVVARDWGFFPIVFVELGNGWMVMLDGELGPSVAVAEALAREPATTENGLANAVGMKPEPGWRAVGLDVTSEVIGVPSIGARADFTPTPPGEPLKDPVTITAYFASTEDAKRALTAMDTPRDERFGDTPKHALDTARKLGDVRIERTTVVYRGPLTKELAQWEQMFVGRAKALPRH